MATTLPDQKQTFPPGSYYAGKSLLAAGGTTIPGTTGDTIEAMEDLYGGPWSPPGDGSHEDRLNVLEDGAAARGAGQRLGALTIHGHSWSASPYWGQGDLPQFNQQGTVARVLGMLGVHSDNVIHLGVAGSRATAPHHYFGTTVSGWAAVCQFIVPNNSSIAAGPDILTAGGGLVTDLFDLPPGGHLWIHGVNDLVGTSYDFGAVLKIVQAYANAMRHYLARCRAGVLWGATAVGAATTPTIAWDSAITFTGTFTETKTPEYGTGASQAVTVTVGDTIEFEIPAATPPVFFLDFEFISTPGAYCLLGISVSNSATSWVAVTDPRQEFPQTGGFTVQVGTELVLVTATTGGTTPTWTVTRARGGTTGAAHTATDAVYRATVDDVAFSVSGDGMLYGTPITDEFSTQGQGTIGVQLALVKRFLCSSSDAGKTITMTTQNLFGTLDKVTFSSAFMEALTGPPCVIVNVPRGTSNPAQARGIADLMNAAVGFVVDEFPGDTIQIADLDGYTYDRSADLASNINNSVTTIPVTARTYFPTRKNFKVSIQGERILVGDVTGTFPNLSLNNCTRHIDGTGAASHTALTNGLTTVVALADIWQADALHLNGAGAAVLAQKIDNAFGRAVLSTDETIPGQALAASSWAQDVRDREPGAGNGYVLKAPRTAPLVAGTPVLQRMTAHLVRVPNPGGWISNMQVYEDAGTAPTTVRLGLYDMDATRARPGSLVFDYGSIAGSASSLRKIVGYKFVRPGLYWATFVQQGGTAAPFACLGLNGTALPVPEDVDFASVTDAPIVGVSATTAVPGALPESFGACALEIGGATAADTVVAVGLGFATKNWI